MKRKWCPDHEWVTPTMKFHPIGIFFMPAYLIYYVAFKQGVWPECGRRNLRSDSLIPDRSIEVGAVLSSIASTRSAQ